MPLTLGVIADTHVPDRSIEVPAAALEVFRAHQVDAIMHAGDVSIPRILRELEAIAPVHAVRGNTDLLMMRHLPRVRRLEFEGVMIGMAHGHGTMLNYVPHRIIYVFKGPKKFSFYHDLAAREVPDCMVVVCGHSHAPANYWRDGQLIFNPGSPVLPNETVPGLPPSVGLLHVDEGNVRGKIVFI
jgi:putative phosphoesterase